MGCTHRLSGFAFVVLFLGSAGFSLAATVSAIPFSTPTDYTNNFRNTVVTDATFGQSSAAGSDGAAGLLRDARSSFDGNDAAATAMYDTTPVDSSVKNTFLSETIQSDFQIANSDNSFGLFCRVNSAETNGYLAIITLNTSGGSNDKIRIYKGVSPITGFSGSQTQLAVATPSAIIANTFYTLTFTATNVGSDVQLSANVYAVSDTSHTTPLMTASATDAASQFTAAGEAGVYFDIIDSVIGHTVDADNFAVVPEPVGVWFVVLFGVFLAARRRPMKT